MQGKGGGSCGRGKEGAEVAGLGAIPRAGAGGGGQEAEGAAEPSSSTTLSFPTPSPVHDAYHILPPLGEGAAGCRRRGGEEVEPEGTNPVATAHAI